MFNFVYTLIHYNMFILLQTEHVSIIMQQLQQFLKQLTDTTTGLNAYPFSVLTKSGYLLKGNILMVQWHMAKS